MRTIPHGEHAPSRDVYPRPARSALPSLPRSSGLCAISLLSLSLQEPASLEQRQALPKPAYRRLIPAQRARQPHRNATRPAPSQICGNLPCAIVRTTANRSIAEVSSADQLNVGPVSSHRISPENQRPVVFAGLASGRGQLAAFRFSRMESGRRSPSRRSRVAVNRHSSIKRGSLTYRLIHSTVLPAGADGFHLRLEFRGPSATAAR